MIKTILFDLDGTLLPMEADTLLRADLSGMCPRLAPHGYSAPLLGKAFHQAMIAMIQNQGRITNEEAFWQSFCEVFGDSVLEDKELISQAYATEFQTLKDQCGFDRRASECVLKIKGMGYPLILATNPVFPPHMTHERIRWAGLDPQIFDYITTFDNSSYCKPNLAYYRELLTKLDLKAEECLMVGNDVTEDMVAETLGMHTFLLTDCLINRENKDINRWNNGSYPELLNYIRELTK